MTHFTPISSLLGGMLIGLAALLLLWLPGRIAGISGIVAGLLAPSRQEWLWRVVFVAGLLLGGGVGFWFLRLPVPDLASVSWPLLMLAGLLVGVGARLGSGCTSGHGICGIGRLSPRSLVATASFMGSGVITVFITHHLL
ncbi:MAG: YeeE/YedE family protein [Aeromonadaceae bacterium]